MTRHNVALREHVTRTAFNLTLSHNHLAALMLLLDQPSPARWSELPHHPAVYWGVDGLERRGLIEYRCTHERSKSETWRATRAGLLVGDLIREAGLDQVVEQPRVRRTAAA